SASLRGLPGPVGFAPGCVNPAGPGCAGTWGTTGEYGGYCGGGIWVCVCSYHSGAVGCDPSSGGRCDQGSCDAGCWLVPSGPVVAGGVPSAGGDQGSCDAGCWPRGPCSRVACLRVGCPQVGWTQVGWTQGAVVAAVAAASWESPWIDKV